MYVNWVNYSVRMTNIVHNIDMNSRNRYYPLVALLLLSLTACSVKKAQETGFLHDYSNLKALPNAPETRYFETDCALWKKYRSVIVDPVEIHFTEDSEAENQEVDIPEVRELAEYFRASMIESLKEHYTITTEIGPNTLRVRTAIVDVKKVDVVANVISKAILYVPVDLGQAAIEGELTDSLTNERFAAIVDRKIGSMLSFTGTYTAWGATKNAFEDWAEQLSELLSSMLQRNTQAVESFSANEVNDNITELTLTFSSPPVISKQFSTKQPARISIDFEKTRNGLKRKFNKVGAGPILSLAVVENGCHTRVVIQLKALDNYQTQIMDNKLIVQVNH